MVSLFACWNPCRRLLRVSVTVALGFLLLTTPRECLANTEEYTLTGDNCNKYLRDKEAVVLKSSGNKRLSPLGACDITLSSANQARWMIYVQTAYLLDCRVKITVFDTHMATTSAQSALEVTCASKDPGVVRLNATVITVRLQHRNATDYNFNLVFSTRYPNPNHICPWFMCTTGDCIPKSLMCDGIKNCIDNSDESKNSTAYCYEYWPFKGENWGVLASVLGAAVILGVSAACCRQLRKRRDSFDELYDLNEGPYVHKYAYQYRVIRHPPNANNANHQGPHSSATPHGHATHASGHHNNSHHSTTTLHHHPGHASKSGGAKGHGHAKRKHHQDSRGISGKFVT